MSEVRERAGTCAAYPGSFNPLHYDHIDAVDRLFSWGYDRVHMFVRDDPQSDIVPWEVKESWFEKLSEEYGGRLIIHRMPSAVSGKQYSENLFADMIREQERIAKEPIRGFYFGYDHKDLVDKLIPLFPEKEFHIGDRGRGYSSTAIRQDPEAHRDWMPDYVYETLRNVYPEPGD